MKKIIPSRKLFQNRGWGVGLGGFLEVLSLT